MSSDILIWMSEKVSEFIDIQSEFDKTLPGYVVSIAQAMHQFIYMCSDDQLSNPYIYGTSLGCCAV